MNLPDQSVAPRSSLDGYLMVVISALLCLGALMVFSAGASVDQQWDVAHFWRYATLRRLAFVPIVWAVLAIVSQFSYRTWRLRDESLGLSPVVWLMAGSIILLALVLVPGIGHEVNGARRWLKFGPAEYGLTFQPSELAKWIVVMFLAAYGAWRGEEMRSFWRGFVPGALVLGVAVALIGKEDFGTAALVGAMGALLLLAGGARWWHLLVLIPLAAIAFYVLVYNNDYRWQRVMAYWQADQEQHQLASAYQARQSITAIGSGGLFGRGLGQGRMKLGWVPEDTTDFVFAVVGEELGFMGCALVVGLFAALILCSILIARQAPDRFGSLLAVAIGGTLGAQAVMNLMVVVGLAPTKGIALPFVSAGGSGLVVTAIAAGVLVNVAKAPLQEATE